MDSLEVMQKLGGGRLIDEINAALLQVSNEVIATRRKGQVTLTLDVSHPDGADPLVVVIQDSIKRSLPKSDGQGAMFYTLGEELHSRDPRQIALPSFRVPEDGSGELRSVEEPGEALREVSE